jgi:hypothetical protein
MMLALPTFSRCNRRRLSRCLFRAGKGVRRGGLISCRCPSLPDSLNFKKNRLVGASNTNNAQQKRGVNRVQLHIAKYRLDGNSPCPERQVEKLKAGEPSGGNQPVYCRV